MFVGGLGRETIGKELEKQLRADGKPATGMSHVQKPRESLRKFKLLNFACAGCIDKSNRLNGNGVCFL